MIGIQAVVVLSAALGATPFDLWQEAHPEQVGAGSLEKSLPFSARTVTYIKTEEPGVSVVVDETGAEIDPSELLLAERALRYRERATWSDEFFVSMAIKPSDYSTDAAVWARVPPPEDPVRPLEDGQMNWEDEQIGQLRDWTATAVAPLKERLVAVGAEVLYVSEFAPVVFVHAPKSVFEQIKFDALVDTIEIEPKQTGGSQTSAQAGRLTSLYSGGITGLGQSVAILEGERVTFGKTTATQNEWENVFIGTNGPRGIPATRDPNCPSTSGDDPDHANAVAGVASGNFGLGWSGAPNATVYSANSCTYTNANLTTAMDWALTKSRIINQSFGDPAGSRSTPSASEQITDWVVRKLAHTAVKICHNTPNTRVACLSFNTINVGGMLNGGTASWANDREFNGQWINPVQDRELPEVVASAAVLSTIAVNTNSRIAYAGPSGAAGGWFGTSFAAPHVSGLAALLMGSRSFLRYWPEALKATVMDLMQLMWVSEGVERA